MEEESVVIVYTHTHIYKERVKQKETFGSRLYWLKINLKFSPSVLLIVLGVVGDLSPTPREGGRLVLNIQTHLELPV